MNLVTRLALDRFAPMYWVCALSVDCLGLFSAMQEMESLHEPFQMTENGGIKIVHVVLS